MTLAWLLLLTGLTLSGVAIYYSVVGLTAIFSAAAIPIIVMGSSLEVAKLVCASWLKANWEKAPALLKTYMIIAVVILMIITSMGIFGFLSKAHSDQSLVSGDVTSKIAVYDEKIKVAKDNIDANRKALKQMDEAVDQVMGRSQDEKGADKAVALRRGQAKERTRLLSEITAEQKVIAQLSEERAPIAAEVRKVEAEVGPLKYIAKFIYGEDGANENMLEKAVTWVIILIVAVFDPLAVIMLLAAQMTFQWHNKNKDVLADEVPLLHETVPHDEHIPVYVEDIPVPEPVVEEYAEVKHVTQSFVDMGEHPKDTYGYEEPEPAKVEEPAPEVDPIVDELPVPLDQWNAMIEEAERAVEQERLEIVEEEAKRYVEEGTEFPENPVLGQLYRRTDFDRPRLFEFNGVTWVDSNKKPQTETEEESKKKSYMTKDQTGQMQVRTRE